MAEKSVARSKYDRFFFIAGLAILALGVVLKLCQAMPALRRIYDLPIFLILIGAVMGLKGFLNSSRHREGEVVVGSGDIHTRSGIADCPFRGLGLLGIFADGLTTEGLGRECPAFLRRDGDFVFRQSHPREQGSVGGESLPLRLL